MSGGTSVVQLHVPAVSDGDASHRPATGSGITLVDPPTLYLEKIGTMWMEHVGCAKPGIIYRLDALPIGYALYEKRRPGNPSHIDKWLYGHPLHRRFDSPNRFFPHFLHLVENEGSNIGCPCTICWTKGGGRIPNIRSSSSSLRSTPAAARLPPQNFPIQPTVSSTLAVGRPRGRPPGKVYVPSPGASLNAVSAGATPPIPRLLGGFKTSEGDPVDDEGMPDVYRKLIDKLKRDGQINEPINEPTSLDWRAERSLLPQLLDKVSQQPSWIPRVGELVLFIRLIKEDEDICWDDQTGEYRIWNRKTRYCSERPKWEAAVVTQAAEERVLLDDLIIQTDKEYNVNYSGFRVEPLPDPNSDTKSLSRQYKYVPLHHLRPFIFWEEFLRGINEEKRHPTIQHALTAMSTLSLLEKYRFLGSWPAATIKCKGIYLGSELLLIGDVVRLLPRGETSSIPTVTDVLKISDIQLKLTNLDQASTDDYDDGHPYNSAVHIRGTAYTNAPTESGGDSNLLQSYQGWYSKHSTTQETVIPFHRVLGRLYEDNAMMAWFPILSFQSPLPQAPDRPNFPSQTSTASLGLSGALAARAFSSTTYTRITPSAGGKSWFWADTRVEALDLATVNGSPVGRFDTSRKPREWRRYCRVLEALASEKQRLAVMKEVLERKGLRGFSLPSFSTDGRTINTKKRPRGIHGFSATEDDDTTLEPSGDEGDTDILALPMDDELVSDGSDDDEDANTLSPQDIVMVDEVTTPRSKSKVEVVI